MAIINRKSGMVRGKIGDEIFYSQGGKQCVRKAVEEYISKNSDSMVNVQAAFSTFSGMWRELPGEIKALWEVYAAAQGCASEVESNDNVSYRYCPIRNYPPRPKVVSGYNMFVGANVLAYESGLSVPRLYPPNGIGVPPLPLFNCEYQRSTGELIVDMEAPTIADKNRVEAIKAVMWLTCFSNINEKHVKIVKKKRLDTFELPNIPQQKVQRRYTGIAETGKGYGYKPLIFKELAYVRVYVGAQVVLSPGEKWAPIVSAGNWTALWLLNQTRYVEAGDIIDAGLVRDAGRLKFNERTADFIARKREELAKRKFVKVSEV